MAPRTTLVLFRQSNVELANHSNQALAVCFLVQLFIGFQFVKRISSLRNLTQLRYTLKLGAISYGGCYCRIRLPCQPNLKGTVTVLRCSIKGKVYSSEMPLHCYRLMLSATALLYSFHHHHRRRRRRHHRRHHHHNHSHSAILNFIKT